MDTRSIALHDGACSRHRRSKTGRLILKKLKDMWRSVQVIFCDGSYSLVGKAAQTLQVLGGYVLKVHSQ